MVLCRIWRGWASRDQADAYEALVWHTIIPEMIEARGIAGFRHIDLMRRDMGDEIEFATIMWFDGLDAVKQFAGEDAEASHVPPAARALLSRWDERAAHYEVLDRRPQPEG
jgi:antibiotic biosynthesis monooxygenase (ABM) superfamily enzyme